MNDIVEVITEIEKAILKKSIQINRERTDNKYKTKMENPSEERRVSNMYFRIHRTVNHDTSECRRKKER